MTDRCSQQSDETIRNGEREYTARRAKFDVDASQREEQTRIQPHVTHSPRPEEESCTRSDQPEHESEVDQAVQGQTGQKNWLTRTSEDDEMAWILKSGNANEARQCVCQNSETDEEERQREGNEDASGTIEAGLVDDRQESGMENMDPPTASVAELSSIILSTHLPLFINLAKDTCYL
ncbi:hypothetical protein BLNAU_14568 [Blattamonas nauphoetae]|uniref:Uncharacterized protein n=1 Tax=Blattamonas nauphoetae TaxID=2049346 RepID=A0ABQ9XGA3_9EUKA|nr:hypothetical protein BLNAU_14568 [Blattamonas nauphoetae]